MINFRYNGKTYPDLVSMSKDMPIMTSVLVGWYEGAEVLCANAAAICYDTQGVSQISDDEWDEYWHVTKRGVGIIRHCRDSHHNTVLEHGSASFFKRVPIFVARQDLRSRHASFDERSLRYCRANDGSLQYYVPPHLQMDYINESGSNRAVLLGMRQQWIDQHEEAVDLYSRFTDEELIEEIGLEPERAREMARAILPLGIVTTYLDTRNLWSWIHHSYKRLCLRSQKETRLLRQQEVTQLRSKFPVIFSDIKRPCLTKAGCPEVKCCGLVPDEDDKQFDNLE